MVLSKRRVTVMEAAEIAGLSYDGLRSWLKRGLLKSTGNGLAKFYARDEPAEVTEYKRWQWTEFGFKDLCAFRLMKVLIDAGLPWSVACSVSGHHHFWWLQEYAQREEEGEDTNSVQTPFAQYLAVQRLPSSPADPVYDYCLYTEAQLVTDIKHKLVAVENMTLVDLAKVRRDVVSHLNALSEGQLHGSFEAGATEVS